MQRGCMLVLDPAFHYQELICQQVSLQQLVTTHLNSWLHHTPDTLSHVGFNLLQCIIPVQWSPETAIIRKLYDKIRKLYDQGRKRYDQRRKLHNQIRKLSDQIRKLHDWIRKSHGQIRKLYDQSAKLFTGTSINTRNNNPRLELSGRTSTSDKKTEGKPSPYLQKGDINILEFTHSRNPPQIIHTYKS